MELSERLMKISESATLALNAKAKTLTSKGNKVFNFTAGEPDFPTPKNIRNAAIEAINKGYTKYTPAAGIPELRTAISEKLARENKLEYEPGQIAVSCGGKHSLYNIIQSVCNPGDEAIIPSPFWVSYTEQVKLADSKPVLVETREEDEFKLIAEDLEKLVSEKTKLIILNSPNNPTGAVFNKEELKKIASIAIENDIFIISDEIYEHLVYEGDCVSIASLGDEIKERTIICNGASKSYAMTGWRQGWAAGPSEIIKLISNFQSQTTSSPTSISQYAYLAALEGNQDSVKLMADEFRKRRDFIVKRMNEIDGVSCLKPQGAFYIFPNISRIFKKNIWNSLDFSMQLLEKERTAVVPGSAFGREGNIRMSYANSMETLEKGTDKIEEFIKKEML